MSIPSDGGVLDMSQFPTDAFKITSPTPLEMKVKQTITARYKPLPDITAYELAIIFPFFMGKPLYEEEWFELGTATRHFERISQ